MSKTIKKALSVLLCAALLFGAAPLNGFAGLHLPSLSSLFAVKAQAAATSGTCGTNLTWSYESNNNTLTISGTGAMYDYEDSSPPWISYAFTMKTVIINNGVTSIGFGAFYAYPELTTVTIANSVTSIGELAFGECRKITSLTIPSSVTSIAPASFGLVANIVYRGSASGSPWGARTLNGYVEYPFVYSNSSKTHLSACPASCSGDISIPNSVTIIGSSAFSECRELTDITIPDSVTSIENGAFFHCTGLTNVTIPDSVTSIGDYAFSNCTGLTSVTVGNSVTSIGSYAFSNCTGLTSVTIPDSVTSIGDWAFYNCTGLTSVTIGTGVMSIGYCAFSNCSKLTDVYYDSTQAKWNAISIGSYNDLLHNATLHLPNGHAFERCAYIVEVVTEEGIVHHEFTPVYKKYNLDSFNNPIVKKEEDGKTPKTKKYEKGDIVYQFETESDGNVKLDDNYNPIVMKDAAGNLLTKAYEYGDIIYEYRYDYYRVKKDPETNKYLFVNGNPVFDIEKGKVDEKYVITKVICLDGGGTMVSVCTVCGLLDDPKLVQPGSHDLKTEKVAPTCYADGYDRTYCTKCDYEVIATLDTPGHTDIAVSESATCTEKGRDGVVCTVCGRFEGTILPATGHHYNGAATKQPTCTQEGVMTYTCSSCGDSYTEPIETVPHSPTDWIILRQPVACTSSGLRVKLCTGCGKTMETEEISPHQFSEWAVTTPVTCTADGEETRTCADCGLAETRPIEAIGHDFGEWVMTTDPTCLVDGEETRYCSRCDATETRPVDALGHDYAATVIAPTCVEAGFTSHVCSRCGDSYATDLVPATGHTYSQWMMFVDPTLTTDGVMGRKCTVCGVVLDQTTVPKLAGDHVAGIRLSSESEYLNCSETLTLTATISPDTAKNKTVIWTSTKPGVATVENGVVTAIAPGVTNIIAQAEDGGDRAVCMVQVNAVSAQNGSLIDNGVITGLSVNLNSLEDYLTLVDESMTLDYSTDVIGTGTKVYVKQGDTVINEFETVIFGDVDGNSWYDGTDAYFVRLVANGMVPQSALTAAQLTACDVNHDGAIDNADVTILEQAGLLLANIDQAESVEELQTNSVYIDYCGLIDQSIEIVESAADEKQPESEQGSFISRIFSFLRTIYTYLFNLIFVKVI